jgi:ABC-type transport system involved in cytochrome c biogenesis permease subunit
MNTLIKLIPAAAVLISLVLIARPLLPQHGSDPYDLDALAALPVSAGGRTKPLDTVARNSLMIISDRQTAVIDGKSQHAMRWLLDVIARPETANDYDTFRIDHPDVRSLIEANDTDQKRFSYYYLQRFGQELNEQFQRVQKIDTHDRTLFQKHLAELRDHVSIYDALLMKQFPYVVPPLAEGELWRPLIEELHPTQADHKDIPQPSQAAKRFDNILTAYQKQNPDRFNQAVAEYATFLDQKIPDITLKSRFEVFFNKLQPFYQGTVLYVVAFLLICGSLLTAGIKGSVLSNALSRATVGILILTFTLHTFGLAARVYMQGYAPVTNLYSSAVFLGWFCVAMGLFLEWLFRNRLGAALAALIGFVTLIIAHNLADGDTMQMMQAVLDSNFWLSTHVITVTMGYSATFLAGFIGITYILTGVYTAGLSTERQKTLGKMMYGVIAFALLFSFVGTVLGGIWADQSWGRFWGWDPKENGAVLIVLMNALILHARWGGMIKARGIAVLAVFGNIITAWSWFGTNMLGVGLHSYGFMDSALMWMLVFVVTQLAIMSAGLIPLSRWRSFSN